MNTRPLTFSVFNNRFDKNSKPITQSWDYWTSELQKPHVVDNKDTFAFVLGEIPAGETHANDKVSTIDAMGLDIDCVTDDQLANVVNQLKEIEYVCYSTFRNGLDGAIKLRFIIPLTRSITPSEFTNVWNGLNKHIGEVNDPQTCNAARLFYVHSYPQDRQQHAAALHHSGNFLCPDEIAEKQSTPNTSPNNPTRFLITRELILEEGRRRLRWRGSRDRLIGQLLRALGRGESFAEKGGRENARFLLCETLAEIWPSLDIERTAELFRPSITAMNEEDPMKSGVNGTLDEIKYKLGRAKTKAEAKLNDRETQRRTKEARVMMEARGDGKDTPYTPEDLQTIADMQDCEVDELINRWIAYKDGTAYFLNMRGYQGPFGMADVRSVAVTFLSPIPEVTAHNPPSRRGSQPIIKSYAELCSQYGSVIADIEASLVHEYSCYNKVSGKLTEVTAPRNPSLKPREDKIVHQWLTLMGGDQAGKLIDWVAAVPKLDRQCCALYLWGAKGVGKTLLCNGLARIWGLSDVTPLDAVIESFNERLSRMPLIVADEYLPDAKNISGKLREFIASTSHTLQRKYRPEASLYGCIRLVILANTPHLLDLKGDHTKEDLDAIAERFLFIHCDKAASAFLEALPYERKDYMLERAVAEHCLWLSENWEIDEGKRFIVEGHLGEANLNISINNERTALICEWLIEYLSNPESLQNNPRLNGLVRIEESGLWVNSYAIQKAWSIYMDKGHSMTARAIGIALKAIASKEEDNYKRERVKGHQRGFYKIDTDLVSSWSEAHGRMSQEDIASIVGGVPF